MHVTVNTELKWCGCRQATLPHVLSAYLLVSFLDVTGTVPKKDCLCAIVGHIFNSKL